MGETERGARKEVERRERRGREGRGEEARGEAIRYGEGRERGRETRGQVTGHGWRGMPGHAALNKQSPTQSERRPSSLPLPRVVITASASYIIHSRPVLVCKVNH